MFRNKDEKQYDDHNFLFGAGSGIESRIQRSKLFQKKRYFNELTGIAKQTLIVEGHIVALESDGGRLNADTLLRINAQYSGINLLTINAALRGAYHAIIAAEDPIVDFIAVSY